MWQPIETAPRDATAILVMRDIWAGTRSGRAEECNGRNTYVAAWWPEERGGQGAWICYMDAVLGPECPVEPTHWMPLPDPPGAQPAPSVPDDGVLKDAERYRFLEHLCATGTYGGIISRKAVDAAMLAATPKPEGE